MAKAKDTTKVQNKQKAGDLGGAEAFVPLRKLPTGFVRRSFVIAIGVLVSFLTVSVWVRSLEKPVLV